MATKRSFSVKSGLDANANSISNLGASSSSLAFSGGHSVVLTTSGATTLTLPTSGTLLYSGGALGTPSGGNLSNCTFPTLNQNTTGSSGSCTGNAATATTAGSITSQANSATITAASTNTINQIVLRDASGNFSANIMTATATSARYADLAENYTSDQQYDYGIVLMIGGDKEVTIATEDTQRLAGVVSQNPAYLMNNACESEYVVAIALQGRTPVRVKGNVCKGDFLVSAGDGYAKATDNPKIGSIIGKSLESFDGQYGMVEAMVGRI
jgi:hypothetical protein